MRSEYKVETTLLGLRRLKGSYSEENIAEAIVAVVETYKIIDKIGYFVLDNAESNDTYISAVIEPFNIKNTKEHRRFRCLGYILNFSAKAVFFGYDFNIFEKEVTTAAIFGDE
jgi:hypothetical protein